MTSSGTKGAWPAFGAALWAAIFAVFHVIWATGWYIGLDAERARIAFAKTAFLVYDLVVAGMCLVAVPVALAPVRPWGRRLPRRLVGLLAWTGTLLLVLRAGASLVQATYHIITGRFVFEPWGIWELWFLLGTVLFGVSTWRYWRRLGG